MIKGEVGWGISTNRLNAEEKLGRNGRKAPTDKLFDENSGVGEESGGVKRRVWWPLLKGEKEKGSSNKSHPT
ncbi:hypothetical protein Hanom_Chr03g00220311 [Helianthus anomalus]